MMGRNYLAEGLANPFGLNSTKGKNYLPDIGRFFVGQLKNPLGLNDSDRWDNRLGGGPRNITPLPPAPASTPSGGSVTRFGGQEYNMSDPKQKAAYGVAQKAELARQGSMADIRGGDGLSDAESRIAPATSVVTSRDTVAPADPNNTGAKGTSMTYDIFRDTMRKRYKNDKFEVRDTADISASSLPGASYGRKRGEDNPFAKAFATNTTGGVDLSAEKTNKDAEDEARKLRRDAFLNAEGGPLAGVRAVEALQGLASAGGQHYLRDSSVEGGLREILPEEYRERRRGGIIPAAKAKAIARKEQSSAKTQTAASKTPQES